MEITIAYFWLLNLCMVAFTIFAIYRAVVTLNLKSKVWNATAVVLVLISLFNPFRMSQPPINTQQTYHIEQSKVLPVKVTDDSFETKTAGVKHLTKQDLD